MSIRYLTVNHLSRKELARFFSRLQISTSRFYEGTPCWEWTGNHDHDGYCCASYDGRNTRMHRLVYAWLIEPLPWGTMKNAPVVDHLCDNPGCWCPWHLDLKSNKANILRGQSPAAYNARKTHCKNGHSLVPGNVIQRKNRKSRECLECSRADNRNRYRAFRAQNPLPPKTVCKNGHALTEENAYYPPSGSRECRLCRKAVYLRRMTDPIKLEQSRLKARQYYLQHRDDPEFKAKQLAIQERWRARRTQ